MPTLASSDASPQRGQYSRPSFPVVGVGASAGGLEALRQFFEAAPDAPDMAFVVVQHLDPNHESMMAQLLARYTAMGVRQITDDEPVEPNTVFVIPPNTNLSIENGRLRLTPFDSPRGLRRPIDDFFRSLAEDMSERSACVVLSGTGADGMIGVRAIKEHGGVTFAQTPDTARYEGMPIAAASTGLVDFVMAPKDIITKLAEYFSSRLPSLGPPEETDVVGHVQSVCKILVQALGHDFSSYKESTLSRRIQRRMRVAGISGPREYLEKLQGSQEECLALFRDLLINVTRFFRDKDVFDALQNNVLPKMLGDKSAGDEVRIWIAGCSSGEEAYSYAMAVADYLRGRIQRPIVQIFATDIDEPMLEIARLGRYPLSVAGDLPPTFLERYTTADDGHITITPKIRDMVRFSMHNMIKDPPFSKLDIVSCRNVLIYMNGELKDRVLPALHYGLVPNGVLVLGNSETIGRRDDLFAAQDKALRIYRRLPGPSSYMAASMATFPNVSSARMAPPGLRRGHPESPPEREVGIIEQANKVVMERYAPAYVIVDRNGDVVATSGRLTKYLEMARGPASTALVTMARPGLAEPVVQIFRTVQSEGRRLAFKDIEVVSEFGTQEIDLIAEPLDNDRVLVMFQDIAEFRTDLEQDYVAAQTIDQKTLDLENEVRDTRLRLRTAIEELETVNEELRSSNEEMMSMNEELQSANEELTTVNEELKDKIDQLALTNEDLSNFLDNTELPMLIVDEQLRIRLFTHATARLYPIADSDIGRPISSFSSTLKDCDLNEEIRQVLSSGKALKREVRTEGHDHYSMRIIPNFKPSGRIGGATVTFFDVTQLLSLKDQLLEESRRLKLALDAAGMGVWEYDIENDVFTVDAKASDAFGVRRDQVLTKHEAAHRVDWDASGTSFQEVARSLRIKGTLNGDLRLRTQSEYWVRVAAKAVAKPDGDLERVVGVILETTNEKTSQQAQALLVREMSHRVKNLFATVSAVVYLSGAHAATAEEAVSEARGRILALARAHDAGRGSMDSVQASLKELVTLVLSPYEGEGRVEIAGPDVSVSTSLNTPLGLVLHEWATNSIKYGSLGHQEGRVFVSWKRLGSNVILEWREAGGPPITSQVDERGFGSVLLNQSVNQMHAHLSVQWPQSGMIAELIFDPSAR